MKELNDLKEEPVLWGIWDSRTRVLTYPLVEGERPRKARWEVEVGASVPIQGVKSSSASLDVKVPNFIPCASASHPEWLR